MAQTRRAVTAAAQRVDLGAKMNVRRQQLGGPQDEWQAESWGYFDSNPEFGNGVLFVGNAIGKVTLAPAARPIDNPDGEPIPVADPESGIPPELAAEASRLLTKLRSEYGGQAAFLSAIAMNLEVVGECYVVGIAEREPTVDQIAEAERRGDPRPSVDPARWMVVSKTEAEVSGTKTTVQDNGRKIVLDPDRDVIFRVWLPHPRWSSKAHCAARHCIPEMRILNALTAQVLASTNSQMHSGILFMSSNMTFGANSVVPVANEEHKQSEFEAALDESFAVPIENPDDLLSVRPMVVTGSPDDIAAAHYMQLSRTIEPQLDARIDQHVKRLARGMALPVEVTEGHQATTFANAEQIDQDTFDDYLEPRCRIIVDAVTIGYLRPELHALGVFDPELVERVICWYEPGELIANPDTETAVDKGIENGAVSWQAWRERKGLTEADAPTPQELLLRFALGKGTLTPELVVAMIDATAAEADVVLPDDPGEIVAPMPATAEAAPAALLPGLIVPATPVVGRSLRAAAPRVPLGKRLTDLDLRLYDTLSASFDAAMTRALDRAAAKLRTKAMRSKTHRDLAMGTANADLARLLGPGVVNALLADSGGDDDLFDGAWATLGLAYRKQVGTTQANARKVTTQRLPIAPVAAVQADDLDAAWEWTEAEMTTAAKRTLYADAARAIAGEADPDMRTPPGLIRQSMARAGGERGIETRGYEDGYLTLVAGEDRAAGGVATGSTMMDALADAGASVSGWTWIWGGASRPFEPHEALDGEMFDSYEDPALSNTEDFPPFPFYFPGDHYGCTCVAEPTVLGPDDLGL